MWKSDSGATIADEQQRIGPVCRVYCGHCCRAAVSVSYRDFSFQTIQLLHLKAKPCFQGFGAGSNTKSTAGILLHVSTKKRPQWQSQQLLFWLNCKSCKELWLITERITVLLSNQLHHSSLIPARIFHDDSQFGKKYLFYFLCERKPC